MPTKRKVSRLGVEGLGLESRTNPSPLTPRFTLPSFTFVSGSVYADANGNGAKDAGENGVNGVTVYADWNGNGAKDAGEPSTVTRTALTSRSVNGVTTTTNEPGFYFFNAGGRGAPASAAVRVLPPAGATVTSPVQSYQSGVFSQTINVGLAGVTGEPSTPATVSNDPVVYTNGNATATVSASSSPTGSSVSVSASSFGTGSVSVSASAGWSNGVGFTSIYVGP